MERYPYGGGSNRVRPDAIIAFVAGVVASYVVQVGFRLGGGGIMTAIIVIAVGGLWYHWRRVV